MRQVPTNPTYLLIGGGRLARHMTHYMEALGMAFDSWNRRNHSTADLIQKINSTDILLLCIKDDEIQNFYEQFHRDDKVFVHFSGSYQHPDIFDFHPLMSFGHDLYSEDLYKSIPVVGTASIQTYQQLFPKMPNTYHQISPEHKTLYHSLCVLSGNGTTLLWDLVAQQFEKIGLSKTTLNPYLRQITDNILKDSQGRWTGPWYRKDQATIENNKQALESFELSSLYQELSQLSDQTGHSNDKPF